MSDIAKDSASFIEPFINGTLETMKVQCQTEAVAGKLRMKKRPAEEPDLFVDIAGVIGVTSDKFSGSISICFPQKTFLALMGRMLSEEFKEITSDLEDGAGELANIVYGTAKRILNNRGHVMQKALPSVVRGEKLQIRHLSSAPVMILPFTTEVGNFYVEIAIELNESKRRSA